MRRWRRLTPPSVGLARLELPWLSLESPTQRTDLSSFGARVNPNLTSPFPPFKTPQRTVHKGEVRPRADLFRSRTGNPRTGVGRRCVCGVVWSVPCWEKRDLKSTERKVKGRSGHDWSPATVSPGRVVRDGGVGRYSLRGRFRRPDSARPPVSQPQTFFEGSGLAGARTH